MSNFEKIIEKQIVSNERELFDILKEMNDMEKESFYIENPEFSLPVSTDGKVYVIDLHPRMYQGDSYVLNKYFRNNNVDLDRFHIPVLDKGTYESIIKEFRNVKPNNLVFETATDYYKKKVITRMISKDLGISEYDLSLQDYKWDEAWYMFSDYDDNLEYMEDRFKEESKDRNEITTMDLYFGSECPRKHVVDTDLWNEIYKFCIDCIKSRIAMIFEIPGVISMLQNILEYTEGFSNFATRSQVETLQGIYNKLLKYCQDKELIAWIKAGNNDYTLYSKGSTKSDYIRTYRNMLKQLEGMSPSDNGAITYYADIITNDIDLLEYEFLEDSQDVEYVVCNFIDKKLYEGGEDQDSSEFNNSNELVDTLLSE